MPKQPSNTEQIICRNCGTANSISKATAKRYFEGYKPPIPMMMMSSTQRRSKPSEPPRCRFCKQPLL